MTGFWIPPLRAVMLCVMVIIAPLAFATAEIATLSGIANGEDQDFTVAANVNPDAPGFAVPIPGLRAVAVVQNSASDDREYGTWLLFIFGLGAVAFALRCRCSEPARHQFA